MTTVESVRMTREFLLPVLSPHSQSIALVIANHFSENSCAVELENEAGENIGGDSVLLPARSTNVRFLNEIIQIPEEFEQGTARVSCAYETGILGLLVDGSAFTTVPAFKLTGTRDRFDTLVHVLPIVADGDGFQSRLFVAEPDPQRTFCALNPQRTGLSLDRFEFVGDVRPSGADAILFLQGAPNEVSPEVRPFVQFSSSGVQELGFGYVTINCNFWALAGHILAYGESGQTLGLATFLGAQTETDFRFPLIPRLGDSGLFFANIWDTESTCAFTVVDNRQSILGESSFTVPTRSSTVQFLNNLIPIPKGFDGGSARISCDQRVGGMGLAISGPVFTSVPPVVLPPANPEPDTGPRLVVTITEVPRFTLGEPVSFPMEEVTGGNPPLFFSLAPPIPGLSFDQETRLLTGTPTEAGTYLVDYSVRDIDGNGTKRNFHIVVAEPDTAPSLAHAGELEEQVYDKDTAIEKLQLPEAAEGNYPLRYHLSPSIPGLSFDAESRQLSGTPTTTGIYHMTYSVTDDDGDINSLSLKIKVVVPITSDDLIDASGCDDGRFTNGRSGSSGLAGDCRALVSVANALIETGLNTEDNPIRQWGNGDQVGMNSWAGVQVSRSRVTAISLNRRQLKGPIPMEIGQLSELVILQISGGAFAGLNSEIPPELGNLTNLQVLNLDRNQLSGSIPPELGNLTNLKHLFLGENQLGGSIPPELGNLTNLQNLSLGENQLGGSIPPELGKLRQLAWLHLEDNNLTGPIPAELGDLSNLHSLRLWRNEFTGSIPAELGSLRNLRDLSANNNRLQGPIPEELSGLESLETLKLTENQLSGEIPAALGSLANLRHINLAKNNLSGEIPPELGQAQALREVHLGFNQLTGPIPQTIGVLTHLTNITLWHNQLSGALPRELGRLSNLQNLFLSANELEGSLPAELGNLPNLRTIWAHENRFAGPIPPELGNLRSLEQLLLRDNRLTGTVPAELIELPNLRFLDVSWNRLSGPLPWAFRDIMATEEVTLRLIGNLFSGLGPPPAREERPSYSSSSNVNGNAAHHSVAYFQGPRLLEWDWENEKVEHQIPILGRWAALAVSIDHEVEEPPSVITRVLDAEGAILAESLGEAAPPATNAIQPGQWRSEYVFHLPGELFQAGNQIVHIIDPDDELAETDEADNVSEPMVLYGERPPRLRVVFVPIQHPDQETWYDYLDAELLMSGVRAFLPVADDFEARIGPAFETRTSNIFITLFQLLEFWNLEAEPDEFYHGLFNGRLGGIAFEPGQVAISGISLHGTIPHELGHNLSLGHTPGCAASGTDKNYPYPNGQLGPGRGWELNWRRFVSGDDQGYADVMSYCKPSRFISDYHYSKASEYWLAYRPETSTDMVTTAGTSSDGAPISTTQNAISSLDTGSLAFSGQINADGVWSLGQAQLSDRGPRTPAEGGKYRLLLFDGAGVQVYEEPLAVIQVSEGDGSSFWAARTPLPLRTAREIVILDARGNEVLRETLLDLD